VLVALGGPIGPVGPIEAVESNGVSTGLCGKIIPTQPVLRGLLVLSATAVNAAVALSTVESDRSVGLEWTIRILHRIELL